MTTKKIEDIKVGRLVRNKKYGNIEEIKCVCKMKLPDGTWVDAVVYKGEDRFTHNQMFFCKRVEEFKDDFEYT